MSVLKNFLKSEDGAVTVDWVVLTASIVGLGLAVIVAIAGGTNNVSTGLGANLGAAQARRIFSVHDRLFLHWVF